MKRLIVLLIALAYTNSGFSQILFKRNEIFFELGGTGLLGSINYERQLTNKPGLGIRVGAGVFGREPQITIPVGVNYLIRVIKNHSYLDLGFGATYTKSDGFFYAQTKLREGYVRKKEFTYLVPSAGVRSYTTRNFVWHVNISPVLSESGLLPFFGLAFGKRF